MDQQQVEKLVKDIVLAFKAEVPVVVQFGEEDGVSETLVGKYFSVTNLLPEIQRVLVEMNGVEMAVSLPQLKRSQIYFVAYQNGVPYASLKEKGVI